ncbi:MAG: cell division protein ZapE, partial [Rhodospirillaceae bacterium]|nr:cell division protein ZapE [Rhodospirillaceae bacterium]
MLHQDLSLECEGTAAGGQGVGRAAPDGAHPDGPVAALARRRTALGLAPDPAQDAAAAALQRLHAALSVYRHPTGRGLHRLLRRGPVARAPRGLYLYGPVGRGKTMLMDLFFAGAPLARKRRAHFSAFMAEVHERLHRLRRTGDGGAAVPRLAKALTEEAWLLCLDELQVDNIGDAMLLHRLFEAILAAGTVVVATSNAAPGELYAGGLQRDRFLPFIALIEARLEVVRLDGGRDYRRARLAPAQVYHWPLGPETEAALARAFALVTGGAPPQAEALPVSGRTRRGPR